MKYIEIDEELYRFIASKTERIGESASDILRRLLDLPVEPTIETRPASISQPGLDSLDDTAREALFNKAKNIVEQLVSHRPSNKPQTDTALTNSDEDKQTKPIASNESPISSFSFNDIVNQQLLAEQKGAVGRFMFLLNELALKVGDQFEKSLLVQGKGRLYFAKSKEELLASSESSNPKQIGETTFWVSTNNNTGKKQTILAQVLEKLGCDSEVAQAIAANI